MPQTAILSSHSPVSSKQITSPPRSASSLRFPMRNVQLPKSNVKKLCSPRNVKLTSDASGSSALTSPTCISGIPSFVSTVSFKTVLDFFHLHNLANASLDEAIFLHILYSSLATQARLLAAILPYSVQRPLQALLAAMSVPAQNCNARSAKRKPLSGSSASSRKRSSTG